MISQVCSKWRALVPIWALGLSTSAFAGNTAIVEPQVHWDGGNAATCTFGVLGGPAPLLVSEPLTVPQGQIRIVVHCGDNPALTPPPVTVKAKAGRTFKPKFKVQRAKLRVMTRRGGAMLPGTARFYEVGRADIDPPLAEHATNATAKLAVGRYDVRIKLADPKERSEVLHSKLRVKAGRNSDLIVDLSNGSLSASATENGRKAEATVRVLFGGTQKKAIMGETGEELSLSAGQYDVVVELRTAANFATKTEKVWVQPNKKTRVKASFKTGKLRVKVVQDGKALDAVVRLSLPLAADFFNFFDAPGPAVLSPGRYSATIEAEGAEALGPIKRSDLVIKAGRTTNISLNITQAVLRASIFKNGRATAGIVEVREPGGGKLVARIAKLGVRLWPGRYELVAKLPDGSEQIDGPFEVKLGDKIHRKITFKRASLRVLALRGPAPETGARILIYRPGAAKPLIKGRHGEEIELVEGTYDVKVIAGADTVWSQGVEVRAKKRLKVSLPELAHADALPEGEDPADDFELPDGDAD